jgi:opacity protein-like surface antigen
LGVVALCTLRAAPQKESAAVRQMLSSIVATVLALTARQAAADNFPGLYVGGAIGQGRISDGVNSASYAPYAGTGPGEFKENHSAFKGLIGIRPISLVGAELEYVDLGHADGTLFAQPAAASMKGAAAFGMLYLPVPIIDVYLKAGAARLQSRLNAVVPFLDPPPLCAICAFPRFEQDRTNTGFAAGGGMQYKFGALAVRAEYERFTAAGEHPNLVSLGLTWSF